MPGVLMCESAAQMCSYYARRFDLLGDVKVVGFGGLEDVRFRDPVRPGDRLYIVCKMVRVRRGAIIVCRFQGFVRKTLVVEGLIKGIPLPDDALTARRTRLTPQTGLQAIVRDSRRPRRPFAGLANPVLYHRDPFSRSLPMGRRALKRIKCDIDLSTHFKVPADLPSPWDPVALFGRDVPIEVEVGSGKGLFLAAAAATQPETDFLGIEISYRYAQFAATRLAQRGLANGRMIHGDAMELFAPLHSHRGAGRRCTPIFPTLGGKHGTRSGVC